MAQYRPDPRILALGDDFYDRVAPAAFSETRLRFRNQRSAGTVGLDDLDDAAWTRHFGRFVSLPGNLAEPLALRYHGHQFRSYNPDLGDGRGFLFGQLRDGRGRLLDLGTKGSGQTPWSRFGDGRLTLKGGVREVLATEMLEALGVETSRTFSLIETGEALERNDEPSPTRSAVLVRLSHGHIRIGSFQRLAWLRNGEAMQRLVDYCLINLLDDMPGNDGPVRLLGHVVARTARLAASYMAAGFVHGVLNTDNIAITAESFDYGPWRFTPFWDGAFTAAYFDQHGLYSFARQPEAIHWNVVQLAVALKTLVPVEALVPVLDRFPALYDAALAEYLLARLGLRVPADLTEARSAVDAMEAALSPRTVTIERFFFDWRGGRRHGASPADDAYRDPAFIEIAARMAGFEASGSLDHAYWSDPEPCAMPIEEVERIWAAIEAEDDWQPFEDKIAAIRRLGEAMTAAPPAG